MIVQTSRFGTVRIDPARVLDFPGGIPGFAGLRRFVLLWADAREIFWWLQSVETPEVAFLVTDPALWVPDFEVPLGAELRRALGLEQSQDAAVLAIVARGGDRLTANLHSPLVVNPAVSRGVQFLPAESAWSMQHELVRLSEPALAGIA
jgi:flagellar assembly factor FliW